jgi:hypothetical protein
MEQWLYIFAAVCFAWEAVAHKSLIGAGLFFVTLAMII